MGIALALVCAVATQLGFLCKHRGAACAPDVRLQEPLRSARELFASRWFAIGMAVAGGAWLLHVAALALAPLSTVQAVLSTGVVMLAVLGARAFGHDVSGRQWVGVAMTAALASVLAFLASARGFQEGAAIPVIASTSTAANLTCIVGGVVVFGDALAAGILLGVQLAAFALVAAAALVTPSGHGRPAMQAA